MFQEEREKEPINLEQFLDAEYQQIQEVHIKQKQVLNDIFEAWGEIFGAKDISKKMTWLEKELTKELIGMG